MDLSKEEEHANLGSTAAVNGGTTKVNGENLDEVVLDVKNQSLVNGGIDEELSNGSSASSDDDERYGRANFANSVDVDGNWNVSYNGSDANADLEFANIAMEEREDRVDDEPSDSPEMDFAVKKSARDLNVDGDLERMIRPHSMLPKPKPPPGVTCSLPEAAAVEECRPLHRSLSSPEETTAAAVDMPSIGKFIREKSNSFSAAITRRLSSLKENEDDLKLFAKQDLKPNVTEFNLSGLKVIVKQRNGSENTEVELKGRISFFSRSNCR